MIKDIIINVETLDSVFHEKKNEQKQVSTTHFIFRIIQGRRDIILF